MLSLEVVFIFIYEKNPSYSCIDPTQGVGICCGSLQFRRT